MNEKTFDPARAHRLDDPARLEWMPPAQIIAGLGLSPGMIVADVGAGTGFFALPFARAVGPDGTVLAVDLQPEMLHLLERKLERELHPGNLRLLEGDAAATHLPPAVCDVAFLANLWHELDNPRDVLVEMRRILRPGGRLAIVDWRADVSPPPGPPQQDRVDSRETQALLREQGWNVAASSPLGPYNYFLLASLA